MLSSYLRLNLFVRMASGVLFEISKAISWILTVVLDIVQRFNDFLFCLNFLFIPKFLLKIFFTPVFTDQHRLVTALETAAFCGWSLEMFI